MPQLSKIVAATALMLAPFASANAEQIAGLTFDQKIVTFDSATPMTIASSFSITGLASGDALIGIDLRPATALIYGVAQSGRVYTLSTTGIASLVSTLSVLPSGSKFGFDFNPMADRLRIIGETNQNLAANVDGGATTGQTAITRASGPIDILASAYTNNRFAATSTVLYGIDSEQDTLVVTAAPGGGVYTNVGSLGVGLTSTNHAAFDISGATGLAYLSIDSAFYTLDLATGATRFVDTIGSGPLIGFTATAAVPEPATWGMMILGFGLVGATLRRRAQGRLALG